MSVEKWSKKEMVTLYTLKNQGNTYSYITTQLNNRSNGACRKKYIDTNWSLYFDESEDHDMVWTSEDKINLYEMKTKGDMAYDEIATLLKKDPARVRAMWKRTNWKKFLKAHPFKKQTKLSKKLLDDQYTDNLVNALITISRHDLDRLDTLTKSQFLDNITTDSKTLPITYTELKKRAKAALIDSGYCHRSVKELGEGTYIIVGDAHGKHTKDGMIKLIDKLSKHLDADAVIHVGHYLDDDNDVNPAWNNIKNFNIIACEEELATIGKKELPHDIIRNEIILGKDLSIANQNLITDYVQTALSSGMHPEYFNTSTITNLHRHEFDTRCKEMGEYQFIASPGCTCEKHIIHTIKQQDFTDGRIVKQTYPSGYKKYRRMKHMYETWQQGCIVVEVDESGECYVYMCRIHKTRKGYTTSYFDSIITEKGVFDPDSKNIIISDIHVDRHDKNILDIQEQFCTDYMPNTVINLGDSAGNDAINGHVFKKAGTSHIDKSILGESAALNFIFNRIYNWSTDNMIMILGNHERFYNDFIDKHPQLREILQFEFINGLKDMDVEIIDLKMMKRHANAQFIHGELSMYGQTGGKVLNKLFRTYGMNTVMGHTHYPSNRMDCYTIPLTGELDLNYNEVNASKWVQGFALCNSFDDAAFITNVLVTHNKLQIANKVYEPVDPDSWEIPEYRCKLTFDFE